MKRTNAPPIPEGLRIELNGEQEWTAVMQVFEDAGWVWLSGTKPHGKNTCEYASIETGKDKKIAYISSRPITLELTAAKFLQQYQETIEYEVGDWVVVTEHILTTDWSRKQEAVGYIVQIPVDKETGECIVTALNNGAEVPISPNKYSINYTAKNLRPATPEEIASVTKVEPVAVKKPEPYIWDGDVLPEEYWVENPNQETCEIAQYLKMLPGGSHWNGDGGWYKVDPKNVEAHEHKGEDDLPIVPYELWKSILEQPASEAEPVTERMFKKGDRIKVVKGIYEGCLGVISDVGLGSLYWADLDSGDKSWFFSGETGTSVDIVHYTEEPAVERWSIVTTDGVTVYAGSSIWWAKQGIIENHWAEEKWAIENAKAGWFSFSTFEAAEEYISKQKQPAGRKWKVGDRYCNPADMADDVDIPNTEGWYIKQVSRDNYKMETVDGEDKMSRYSYTAKQIDNYIKRGDWIPYSENKEKEDNTIISKQTKNQTTNNGNNKQQSQQDSYSSNINNQSSGYSGTAFDLRADQETVSAGSRSTGTSLRCSGQSELFAVKHSGYPKGSGYCEEV